MDGPRYFRLAIRLPFYEGAMRIVALGLAGEGQQSTPEGAAQLRAVNAGPGGVTVNVPGHGPSPLPAGANYVDGDRASLMASPVFRDMIEFGRG